ncbi:interaptin-like [Bradysia coprophila]|uniref:interaptin-like n=1 Tax=Bradysia coprophila TaxID=38358 RepID=UPI00187DCB46|nr:interaptin-like [Bradysia coprophila]
MMILVSSYFAASLVVLVNALTPNLLTDENLLNTNAVQSENAIDSNINPLDYLFNHSSEFQQIYSMFGVLLNSRKEYEFNMLLPNATVLPPINESIQQPPSKKSLSPPHMCVASHDDLFKIWNEMNKNNTDKFLHFDSITLTQSAACSEVDRLKTAILIIKQNFDEMLHKEISSKQYKELKTEYEEKFKKLQQQLNVAQTIVSQDEKIELDSMQNELQVQHYQISNVLRKMESERRILNDAYIRLCIADLERQNISSAVEAFMNITERAQIRRIIYAVYANKEENFKVIFEFVKQTNDLESFLLGYSSLYEQMKTNQHMNVMNLLLLTNAIIQHRHDEGFKQLFNSLNESVKVMHQESDYEKFYTFMYNKNNESLFLAKDMIATFVEGAYNGNIGNVDKVLSMIPKLDVINHRLHLIDALLNEMKLHSHSQQKEIFMVIYQLTQTRIAVHTEKDKLLVTAIEQNLPENVRDLIFTNLCIQNANNNEYLYSGQPSDESRRYVFTSVINKFDDTFDFEMEFMDKGRKVLIKNSHYREHLYVTENGSPRTLLSWMPAYLTENTEAHFSLEIIDGPYFRVRSEHYGEYLFSPINKTYTEDNRKVYFRPEKKVNSDSTWKIQTCRHRVRYE